MKYKITLETIQEYEYDEVEFNYIDEKTGQPGKYPYDGCKKEYYKTGKKLLRTDIKETYTQTIEDIDVALVIKAANKMITPVNIPQNNG